MIQLGIYAYAVISAYAFTAIILFVLVFQTLIAFKKNKTRLEKLVESKNISNE